MMDSKFNKPLIRIIDDDSAVRSSWSFLLSGENYECAEYSDAGTFLASADFRRPGCILLDVRMPSMSGLELQNKLKDIGCDLPIVFVSGHGDIDMAVKTMKDGADDFLSKPVTPERLLDAIEKAVKRDARIRTESAALEQARAAFRRLSAREQEVATGVARGLLNKQIAYDLGISIKTVEAHRASIMDKTNSGTVADLMRVVMGTKLLH